MTRTKPLAALALATILLAACSKTSSSTSAATSAATLPSVSASVSMAATDATTYMTGLCTSVSDWQQSIQDGDQAFQDSIAGGTPTPESVQVALSTYLTSAVEDTQNLVTQIEALGAPDVAGGADAQATIVGALNDVATLFQSALDSVQGLDTTNPAQMATALQDLATTLQEGGQGIADALGAVDSGDFASAAQDIPACRSL